jgi:uncharacterized membrane protein YgdD (TMEM256/DUF423 family)
MGLIGCSLIASNSLLFKVAATGFLAGQLLFITPLYISAIKGRDPNLGKLMPVGGTFIIVAWPSLMFA